MTDLGEDGLVLPDADAEDVAEGRDADEHHAEDADQQGQGGTGVAGFGRFKGRDPVADGFNSGHRRTARGEGPQDEEPAHRRDRRRRYFRHQSATSPPGNASPRRRAW